MSQRSFEQSHGSASATAAPAANASPKKEEGSSFTKYMIVAVLVICIGLFFLIAVRSGAGKKKSNRRVLLVVVDDVSAAQLQRATLSQKMTAYDSMLAQSLPCKSDSSVFLQSCTATQPADVQTSDDSLASLMTGVAPGNHQYRFATNKVALNPSYPSILRAAKAAGWNTGVVGAEPVLSHGKMSGKTRCGFFDAECMSLTKADGSTEDHSCFEHKNDGFAVSRASCNIDWEVLIEPNTDIRNIVNGTTSLFELSELIVLHLDQATLAAKKGGSAAEVAQRRDGALYTVDAILAEVAEATRRRSYAWDENWLVLFTSTTASGSTPLSPLVLNKGNLRKFTREDGELDFIDRSLSTVDVAPTIARWFNFSAPTGVQGQAIDV